MYKPSFNNIENQSTKLNPFGKATYKCPICENPTVHISIKNSFYLESDPDVDLYPRKLTWLKKGFEDYYPRNYYMCYCSMCSFTSGYHLFEEPIKDCTITSYKFKKTMKNLLSEPRIKMVAGYLSDNFDGRSNDFSQAFKIHYLALFELLQIEEIVKNDSLNLGRYLLRLAWLFRDIAKNDILKNNFLPKVKSITQWLKKYWPDVPEDEDICLKKALEYYKNALEHSTAITTEHNLIMAILLIARLLMKNGQIPEAKWYISQSREIISKLEKSINISKESIEKTSEILSDIKRMTMSVDDVRNIFENYWALYEKKQLEKGRNILKIYKNKPPEKIREILLANKIEHNLVYTLVPAQVHKKGGIFSFFS
ncbi:MAG: DUF2225 domain-containing protein [Desulfobacterales bacterium]|nr:DUF2225 domain-containing protein [Desulfobacterales bacterium]